MSERCFGLDDKTGAYTLDGLTPGESYTVKTFSAAKAKAGKWTTESGYAIGMTTATSAGATLGIGVELMML